MRVGRTRAGISLIEIAVVLAIVGIFAAIAVPSLNSVMQAQYIKKVARNAADKLLLARAEAIRTGDNHVVFWGAPGATDPNGTALTDPAGNWSPLVVLNDGPPATANCHIDAGETFEGIVAEGDDLNWGTTAASAAAPGDGGTGVITAGWSFEDPASNPVQWLLFRPDGIPVAFTVSAGSCGTIYDIGTGSGGFYITDGKRDYSVVVTPLGNVRVHHWRVESGDWSS